MHRMIGAASLFVVLSGGGAVQAQDFPPRKPGLWQVEMTIEGGQVRQQAMKMCIDTTTDAEMHRLGMNASQGMCNKPDISRSGNTVTVNAACKMGQTESTTHAVTKFTGDTAYHTDSTTKFNPPLMGRSESTVTQDAKWAGPCPADMQPGDVMMGNGMKLNIKQMLGGRQ